MPVINKVSMQYKADFPVPGMPVINTVSMLFKVQVQED